jgi:hypothetical protein
MWKEGDRGSPAGGGARLGVGVREDGARSDVGKGDARRNKDVMVTRLLDC